MHLSCTSIHNEQERPTAGLFPVVGPPTGYREPVVVGYQAPSVAAGLHKFSPAWLRLVWSIWKTQEMTADILNCVRRPGEVRLLMPVTPGVNFNPDTKQYSYANPDGAKLA